MSVESDWIFTGALFIFSESKFAINFRRALKNARSIFADASLFTSLLFLAMLQIDSYNTLAIEVRNSVEGKKKKKNPARKWIYIMTINNLLGKKPKVNNPTIVT